MKTSSGRGTQKRRRAASGKSPALQQVRDAIIERIRDGRYAPGHRLVSAELTEELGHGPSVIRDALQMLGGEGAVQLIPNKGARVPKFTGRQVADLLQALDALCQLGFRLAAARIHEPGNAEKLRKAMRAIRTTAKTGNANELLTSLVAYHYVVHDIGGNAYLNFLLDRFHLDHVRREIINSMFARAMSGDHWILFVGQYEEMTDRLLDGDVVTAQQVLTEHLQLLSSMIQSR